ncbi:ATP-binding cassette domain-containing protein [Amycolatopsis sp. La24]|uniref:ABC transporter ATP-binding protein n=1 Tax=Amycolatopsis sp. La24 TaxID=3028304 RepID=UPI0023AFBAF7|nr:ATP-binding cassette domain-containing protein [Amycolatopsis sp. La24]
MSGTPLVVCDDAARTFGCGASAVVAVHGTSCTVARDDRIAIAGPSGSGKSTLLHLLAGLEQPTRGQLHWPGLAATAQERAREIGVVFQGPSLLPTLTVADNAALPLDIAGIDSATRTRRVRSALDLLGVGELAGNLPEEISGGQAQRVAVARVLAQRPRLILADEPTGQLDRAAGQRLLDALLDAADRLAAALVVTTHDRRVAARMHTRWTMHEGRLQTSTAAVAP